MDNPEYWIPGIRSGVWALEERIRGRWWPGKERKMTTNRKDDEKQRKRNRAFVATGNVAFF